ncbi:MAG: DNA-directed RNA polymerase subunit alpha [Candidatus Peregrinibacteria bacterium]
MHIIQEEIGIPKIVEKVISPVASLFIISPLPAGFGQTLGNALRRTLLSSVPGTGMAAVKVKGAPHEYTSLIGVKDSVLDLILSLKKVSFQMQGKEPLVLKLEKKGDGQVLAGDIEASGDVEILNPDFVITHLDKKTTSLSVEIRLEKGVGYSSAKERRKESEDAGWILLDTIYSPIRKVRYDVTAARVGERTNLDQLELEIETTGALSPSDVLKFSARILESYFTYFQTDPNEAIEESFFADFAQSGGMGGEEGGDKKESYTPIEILNLSPRTLNALINGNIGSVEEVLKCTPSQLEGMRGFGKKAMTELMEALVKHGYEWIHGHGIQ